MANREYLFKSRSNGGKREKLKNITECYHVNAATSLESNIDNWKLNPERYSSWTRLTRILAWVYRFLGNAKLPNLQRNCGELSVEEIRDAELSFIRNAQMNEFKDEYSALKSEKCLPTSSKLLCLYPLLDDDGMMRVNGRLKNAEFLSYNTRYPIILSRKNWITKLIVKQQHLNDNHIAETNQALASLSSRYWLLQGREEIREWERECNQCKKNKAKQGIRIMAPLPKIRVKFPLRAFSKSAVDFAGPFITMQGRGKAREKRYLCLFTCLLTRAVHLELAFGLDTDRFLNAFYRMANRRGMPQEIISDNGTNFVGAKRELYKLIEQLDIKNDKTVDCQQRCTMAY